MIVPFLFEFKLQMVIYFVLYPHFCSTLSFGIDVLEQSFTEDEQFSQELNGCSQSKCGKNKTALNRSCIMK